MLKSSSSRSFRKIVLTGASAFALAGAAVGVTSAMAAPGGNIYSLALSEYSAFLADPVNNALPEPDLTQGVFTVQSLADQLLFAPVTATVGAVEINLSWNSGTWDGSSVVDDPSVMTFTGTASDNTIFASATGNLAKSDQPGAGDFATIDLADLGQDESGSAFVSQYAVQSAIQASVTDSGIDGDAKNVVDADSTLAVTGNTIRATTAVNQNTPDYQVAGTLDLTQSSSIIGGSSVTSDLDGDIAVMTLGTVAVTNLQVALDSGQNAPGGEGVDDEDGSFARVTDSHIRLEDLLDAGSLNPDDLTVDDGEGTITANITDGDYLPVAVDSTFNLDDNAITASFTGNLAQNRVLAESGEGSAFTGSVAITNGQLNLDTMPNGEWDTEGEPQFVPAAPNVVASVEGNEIMARIQGAQGVTVTLEVTDPEGEGGETIEEDFTVNLIADFTGVLSVSGNTIGAAASGNVATNGVLFEDGISVEGAGGESGNSLGYPNLLEGSDRLSGQVSGDLSVLNVQSNQGTYLAAEARDNAIGAEIDVVGNNNLVNGETDAAIPTVAIQDNAILAEARGNVSSNYVVVEGATTVDATVAVGNLQTNSSSEGVSFLFGEEGEVIDTYFETLPFAAVALNEGSSILGVFGGNGGFGDFNPIDFVQSGVVDVSGNTVGATAKGNTASTAIAIDAASLISDGGGTVATAESFATDSEVIAAIEASGGITATNLQSNFGEESEVGAVVVDAVIGIDFSYLSEDSQEGDELYPLDLTDAVYAVDDNAIAATAYGNEVKTQIVLTGVSGGEDDGEAGGAFTAAIASAQNNEADVDAVVAGGRILISNAGTYFHPVGGPEILGDGLIESSVLSVSDNEISATAVANKAEHLLAVYDFSSLTLGTSVPTLGDEEGEVDPNYSASVEIVEDNIGPLVTLLPEGDAQGNFVVFNSQWNQGDVSAEVTMLVVGEIEDPDPVDLQFYPSAIGVLINGDVQDAVLTVDGNAVGATATANQAKNELLFDGLAVISEDWTQVATIANLQGNAGDVSADNFSAIGITVTGEAGVGAGLVGEAVLSVSGNSISAAASGNVASNRLEALDTARGLGDFDETDFVTGVTFEHAGEDSIGVAAAYSLLSVQANSGDIAAEVSGVIGTDLDIEGDGGVLRDSLVVIEDNAISAVARGNAVTNVLTLEGTAVGDSAAIGNYQVNLGGTAAEAFGLIGLTATQGEEAPSGYVFDDVVVSLDGNSIQATAVANAALNVLAVGGTVIGGTLAEATTDYDDALDTLIATGDFTLLNVQNGGGVDTGVLAVAAGAVGLFTDGSITDGVISVSGNSIGATAVVNSASNVLSLEDATAVGASAAVSNSQVSWQSSTAAATGAIGIDTDEGIQGAVLNVSGNAVSASAAGNSASNVLNVEGMAVAGVSGALSSVGPNGSSTEAAYVVNNYQQNAGPINAGVTGTDVGAGSSSTPLASVAVAVNGNQVMAQAIGNSASNSIAVASVTNGASAAITSVQVNTASVSATVSGVWVGASGGLGSNGVASVSGNSVGATAVGNSVSNSIKSGSGL